MIPKKIHYCWFGGNKKSKLILKCMDSWRKFFPDYEIIEWNETNIDLHENVYVEQAYKAKKWAFVSDYVRMKVLYENGGIYFDTDVEVLKPFPDEVLSLSAFTGFQYLGKAQVNPGNVFACEAKNEIVRLMIESYNNDVFRNESIDTIQTINKRITDLLARNGLKEVDEKQTVMGLTVFPSSIFCPYDHKKSKVLNYPESLTAHYFAGSWTPWYRKIRHFFGKNWRRLVYR